MNWIVAGRSPGANPMRRAAARQAVVMGGLTLDDMVDAYERVLLTERFATLS